MVHTCGVVILGFGRAKFIPPVLLPVEKEDAIHEELSRRVNFDKESAKLLDGPKWYGPATPPGGPWLGSWKFGPAQVLGGSRVREIRSRVAGVVFVPPTLSVFPIAIPVTVAAPSPQKFERSFA